MRHAAVLDIGKTNVKLALVDMVTFREIKALSMPNTVLEDGPYRHFDTEAIWKFTLAGLREYHRFYDIDGVSVTTHGAAAALVDATGNLVLPVLDYEDAGPGQTTEFYDFLRPEFAKTGSPRVANGLNLGAQLFWQAKKFAPEWKSVAAILTLPQYWAFRLSGVMASEVTSLGCHTDLWEPAARKFSSIVSALGWQKLMPPIRFASSRLGPVTAEVAAETALGPDTGVWCGIHDSNASLLPHVLNRERPVTVISTGTWVIAMALGGAQVALDAAKDTLLNVDALGDPVPSARFMGGREFSLLMDGSPPACTNEDLVAVIGRSIRVDRAAGIGQFKWTHDPASLGPGERFAAVTFFLARQCVERLDWIGARGPVIVEGPFAANTLFLDALAVLTGRPVKTSAGNATGTSVGAALLIKRPDRVGQTLAHPVSAALQRLAPELQARQAVRT